MDQLFQSYRDDERRIGEEYLSSLQDLNCNSKPLINMLTMLAEENINYAHIIVKVVEYYISQVNKTKAYLLNNQDTPAYTQRTKGRHKK